MNYEMRGQDTRTKGRQDDDGPVFYNKVQVFNRDLSCTVISLFAQWRFIERAEYRARRGLRGEEAAQAAKAERTRLYNLTAAELDELLRKDEENGIKIMDALAATGLRSIRYAKEIPGVKRVVANDVDEDAASACAKNIEKNRATAKCEAKCSDAVVAMIQERNKYDVIDIDPYGSCAPFIDAAVQSVSDGGLLCVTSTDMPVLSGNFPEVCYSRYGSMPTKAKHLHEYALRVVLNFIETTAARYQRHIVPVVSVSVDFYVRVFVRVFRKPIEVKKSCLKRGYVLQSAGCPSFYIQPLGRCSGKTNDKFSAALLHSNKPAGLQLGEESKGGAGQRRREKKLEANGDQGQEEPEAVEEERNEEEEEEDDAHVAPQFCGETGAPFKVGGPIWIEPLFDADWVAAAIDRIDSGVDKYISTGERIHGVMTALSEELRDVPLYYTLPDITGTLHCSSPKLAEMKAALTHAGYRCSQSHRDADAVKTDAPPRVIWDIMRCWCVKHPVAAKRLADPNSVVAKILGQPPKLAANFATTAAMRTKQTKARRWAPNPEEYWGPKAAAHGRKKRKIKDDDTTA